MNVYRRNPARAVIALAAAVLVLVIGAATAFGRGTTPSSDPGSKGGVSSGATGIGGGTAIAVSPPDAAVGSGIAMPAWCCGTSGGVVPGLTTVGQATMDGQGQDARDAAIAAAVKDATAQANAAADAAGIHLGALIDMQVSAMPYYYPIGMASDVSGTTPGAPGGTGGAETKPAPTPDPYFGSVSVTMTWSLG
jgi:Protein of unknown function (DUF541)